MYLRVYCATAVLGLFGGVVHAQNIERRANFTGGGGPEGKCTVEVIVDGAAQVEIRGDRAILRNLFGQTPQWRRFECTSPMPANPVNFRFQGVDGRGSQKLLSDPRRGGPLVVRIDDPDNGSEGYTFDVFWQGQGGGFPPPGGPGPGAPVQDSAVGVVAACLLMTPFASARTPYAPKPTIACAAHPSISAARPWTTVPAAKTG